MLSSVGISSFFNVPPRWKNPAVDSSLVFLINFVRSLFFFNMTILILLGLRQLCVKSIFFLFTRISDQQNKFLVGADHGEEGVAAACTSSTEECCACRPCNRQRLQPNDGAAIVEARGGGAPSAAEMALVMERLGVKLNDEEEEDERVDRGGCFLVEVAEGVLEEKAASAVELEAAFAVFDRDGDGYVGAEELREVMWRRLGWEEGAALDDCRRMIGAFDEDGDGRIDLADFRRLLESAS